jgi:adenosylmethionine-8-amino-7-oxononanoate aminotransferase
VFSACTLGHQPPRVNQAIKDQLDKYSHVMVANIRKSAQLNIVKLMASLLPEPLDKTYLVRQLWN